ncbi:esterase family protein [Streptomyces sp. SCA3-4]|uniref:alpha/beta hydrolase n=1 Tax=Streptomyces sichuanensis TaxID=2871810 RepID=UPI001CE3AB6E|nr:alpha/beta hydrolase-fold protein [Streptomyces sichuanensis]MCA6095210.1 esterase family protein [Streptomyces sichuanensis]
MTHIPDGTPRPPGPGPAGRRSSGGRRWAVVVTLAVALGLIAWPVLASFDVFSDKGDPLSFGQDDTATGRTDGGGSGPLMPTGPKADFRVANTLADGTKIGVVTLDGKKSGFKGKVWVWAPQQYDDPKYAKSGFPVLIALPGGNGYPVNYWMGTDLKLQSSIAEWSKEGKSLPFIVAMPVLNADDKNYYDGSDIPGRPKMGTWLTEDVPDLIKQNFRTLKSRDGWAFMGSSSGAFAGLKAVLKQPGKFKAVIASGPDIVPDSPLWAGHDKEKRENNPQLLAQHLIDVKGPDVYLAFQVGTKEKTAMANTKDFLSAYGNKGPVHTMLREIPDGEHNARTYVPSMGQGPIEWISKHMEGPTPSG